MQVTSRRKNFPRSGPQDKPRCEGAKAPGAVGCAAIVGPKGRRARAPCVHPIPQRPGKADEQRGLLRAPMRKRNDARTLSCDVPPVCAPGLMLMGGVILGSF